jgi:hypothetical protein
MDRQDILDVLPQRHIVDRLVQRYFIANSPSQRKDPSSRRTTSLSSVYFLPCSLFIPFFRLNVFLFLLDAPLPFYLSLAPLAPFFPFII